MAIHNSILFVGPLEMGRSLFSLLPRTDFWNTVFYSFRKIGFGFLLAFFGGLAFGSVSYRFRWLRELLEPILLLMKSVPVASFVILALIWMGSKNLSVFVTFFVVFPVIYVNTISGLASTDPALLEMADVFHMSVSKRIFYIYRPALLPYLISGCKTALGMSWKSGTAAEVIGVTQHSIGGQLYLSKIYLDTAGLFAWTLVIILVSAAMEYTFLFLLDQADRLGKASAKTTDLSGGSETNGN